MKVIIQQQPQYVRCSVFEGRIKIILNNNSHVIVLIYNFQLELIIIHWNVMGDLRSRVSADEKWFVSLFFYKFCIDRNADGLMSQQNQQWISNCCLNLNSLSIYLKISSLVPRPVFFLSCLAFWVCLCLFGLLFNLFLFPTSYTIHNTCQTFRYNNNTALVTRFHSQFSFSF